jgi:hypothetical protein
MHTQICQYRKKRKGLTKTEVPVLQNDICQYTFVRIILKT